MGAAEILQAWCVVEGFEGPKLKEWESNNGPMPEVLKQWQAAAGASPILTDPSTQNVLRPLDLLRVQEGRVLRLFSEAQDSWHCGVLASDAHEDDPPVYFESVSLDLVEEMMFSPDEVVCGNLLKCSETLSSFLDWAVRQVVCLRNSRGPGFREGVRGVASEEVAEALMAAFDMRPSEFPAGFSSAGLFDGRILVVEDWGICCRHDEAWREVIRVCGSALVEGAEHW